MEHSARQTPGQELRYAPGVTVPRSTYHGKYSYYRVKIDWRPVSVGRPYQMPRPDHGHLSLKNVRFRRVSDLRPSSALFQPDRW